MGGKQKIRGGVDMTEMVYQRARREALNLRATLSRHQGLEERISMGDLIDIAEMLDAEVSFFPLEREKAGYIIKQQGDSIASIVINKNMSIGRQKFTLAHEIGHLIDRNNASDKDYAFMDHRDERNPANLHEFFANEFAGALLMPAQKVHDIKENYSTYEAANYFGVTVSAVTERLRRLQVHPEIQEVAS